MTKLEIRQLIFYLELVCAKLDLASKYFMKRVSKKIQHKPNEVEFIERMYIEPLDTQVSYLFSKVLEICRRT